MPQFKGSLMKLWFDVEERYNTTQHLQPQLPTSCGLMQKKDITQHQFTYLTLSHSCGLMQKKDITQHHMAASTPQKSCGLMQKKDITQLQQEARFGREVVA